MATIAQNIASKIPVWIGFLALIIIGVVMVIVGAILSPVSAKVGFITSGLCVLLVGAFSWIVGGTSKIKGRVGRVGVKVNITDIPWWAWLVDIGLVAIAVIIIIVAG